MATNSAATDTSTTATLDDERANAAIAVECKLAAERALLSAPGASDEENRFAVRRIVEMQKIFEDVREEVARHITIRAHPASGPTRAAADRHWNRALLAMLDRDGDEVSVPAGIPGILNFALNAPTDLGDSVEGSDAALLYLERREALRATASELALRF